MLDLILSQTVNGIVLGFLYVLMAIGLTVIFGLLGIVNFAHGAFFALGAYFALSLYQAFGWPAVIFAPILLGIVAMAAEVLLFRRTYGKEPLVNLIVTFALALLIEALIKVIWGPQQIPLPLPEGMRGSWLSGDAAVEKYRVVAVIVGVLVFAALAWTLSRTKVGLLIRAGVQDREMVESLGYRIRRLFIGVFVVGSALAGLGGVMWGLYQQNVIPQMGAQVNILIFIVIIIGGLGSTTGALIGALMVGLMANYTGFLAPKVALFSNIALMVAVLLWRPQGVYPVANR